MAATSDASPDARWATMRAELDGSYPTTRLGAATEYDASQKELFGLAPMSGVDYTQVVQCQLCSKPVLETALARHTEQCKLDSEGGNSTAMPASVDGSTKKRPGRPPKASNVDSQCGVLNEKGVPCTKSLNCKTHSLAAKRSVPHRSQPFDILLQESLSKKQNGSSVTSVDTPAQPDGTETPAKKDGDELFKVDKNGRAWASVDAEGESVPVPYVGEWPEDSDVENDTFADDFLDSDEEIESVMRGTLHAKASSRSLGIPVDTFVQRVQGCTGKYYNTDGPSAVKPPFQVIQKNSVEMGQGAGISTLSMFTDRNMTLSRIRIDASMAFNTNLHIVTPSTTGSGSHSRSSTSSGSMRR